MKKKTIKENREHFGNWAKKNLTKPNEEVFCEGATIARHHVKKKILLKKIKIYYPIYTCYLVYLTETCYNNYHF